MAIKKCSNHTAYIYDRGGVRQMVDLTPLARVKWERRRDDISTASAFVREPSKGCKQEMGLIKSGRSELVIFRGNERVWEGPVTRVARRSGAIEVVAHDVMHYVNRTAMRGEYDNSYPNVGYTIDRVKRIMTAEMARKEALDPPANILPHVKYLFTLPRTDTKTSSHTQPMESSVYAHIDNFAARGGLDYTVVGRSILFWDVHQRIGQTATVTASDFLDDPIITEYGMELGTHIYITNGKGQWGEAGALDPYYGEWEIVQEAYDENTAGPDDDPDPSVAEMSSQAQRLYSQSKKPPLVVRVPDNSSLNPNGVLSMGDLVPGVWIPLSAQLGGVTISQMQKLDNMAVEESAEVAETINVTLSPAPIVGTEAA